MYEFIGRYRVVGKLGEGAMAEVYEAEDPKIQRRIAIKVLRSDPGEDKEITDRFLREATMAGSLSHPNIVTVYDVGEVEGQPYIAMELLRGHELSDVTQPGEPFDVLKSLKIVRQIASALDAAHAAGIIHRDIKPSNVFLCHNNEKVQVLDFGVARIEQADRERRANLQATQVGTIIGTPRYMSPEQATGKPVDRRSDLFSLGVILYELLTGQKTFQATTVASLMLQITQEEPKPIRELVPSVPRGVQFIIKKLLAKDPGRRYDSAAQLVEALDREITALTEQSEAEARDRFLPLPVKLSAGMAGITLLLMVIATSMIQGRIVDSMRAQLIGSGVSLAKIIASQSATPVLGEEWFTIEAFVDEAARRDSFSYLVITDFDNVVRGANDRALLGQPYAQTLALNAAEERDGITVASARTEAGDRLFVFEAPILFQNQPVGRIHLGLSKDPLAQVSATSATMMVLLAIVVILAVSAVTFVVARLLQRPVRTLNTALREATEGNFQFRISHTRRDEFGRLFDSFNALADSRDPNAAAEASASPVSGSETAADDALLPTEAAAPTDAPTNDEASIADAAEAIGDGQPLDEDETLFIAAASASGPAEEAVSQGESEPATGDDENLLEPLTSSGTDRG